LQSVDAQLEALFPLNSFSSEEDGLTQEAFVSILHGAFPSLLEAHVRLQWRSCHSLTFFCFHLWHCVQLTRVFVNSLPPGDERGVLPMPVVREVIKRERLLVDLVRPATAASAKIADSSEVRHYRRFGHRL
jgi:hypothetical protein